VRQIMPGAFAGAGQRLRLYGKPQALFWQDLSANADFVLYWKKAGKSNGKTARRRVSAPVKGGTCCEP
jgi:hypothetical protein